ncbi:MAG: methyltransferase [Polyangiales bacterium]
METSPTRRDEALRFEEASAMLASVRDIIAERPVGPTPTWAARRGWDAFLSSLTDAEVSAAERDGLAAALLAARRPADLVALSREVARLGALPTAEVTVETPVDARRASPRKQAQVAAFASIARAAARGRSRVVDVGSGHGHLTRHLATALGLPAEGWERDAARVAVASSLSDGVRARFVTADVREAVSTLTRDDLVVGLHACGALGDLAVSAASEVGASVVIVGCCLQKRDGDRAPLTPVDGIDRAALTIGRAVLGLGNARDGDEGVEDDLATRTASRVNRSALRALLVDAGCEVPPGEEMRGVNRRRATGSFHALVAFAFEARAIAAPPSRAVDDALRRAQAAYEMTRRWSLPRWMLARFIEVWVALDRAALLARRGYDARATVAFDARESPRNIAVIGLAPR